MTQTKFQAQLERIHACGAARKWVGYKTARKAWDTCERPDWMFWLADRVGVDRRLLVLAAASCARSTLKYVPAGEDRPRLAIEAAEAWVRGEVTVEQVRNAANAAYAAADAAAAAYADAAADAARAAAADAARAAAAHAAYAAYAAHAAAASANAAAYAANAAYAAADAAARAAAYAARAAAADAAHAARRRCCEIIRHHIPFAVLKLASLPKEQTK